MSRTLIKTETSGWYMDAADPSGKKVRRENGDTVLTREQFEAAGGEIATPVVETADPVPPAEEGAVESPVEVPPADQAEATRRATVEAAAALAPTEISSGKLVQGKTVTIRCAWVDPDKRTKAQQKLFDGDRSKLTYEKVVKAAGDDANAMPSGEERVIKPQDAFQVRFSVENQEKARAEARRKKNAKRRAEIKAAKASK